MADSATGAGAGAGPDGTDRAEGDASRNVRALARREPSRTAIVAEGTTLTYDELDTWADALAVAVLDVLGPGDHRVAYCHSGAVAMVVTDLALDRAGKVAVGLRYTDPPARLGQMTEDAGCSLVVTDLDELELGSLDRLRPFGHPPRRPGPVDRPPVLAIAYTSGSTGAPKGIVQTRRWSAHFLDWGRACGVTEARRPGMLFAGPTAAASLSFGIALAAGVSGTVLDLRATGLADVPAWLHDHRIDRILFIPSLLRALLAGDPDPRLLAGIRQVGFAGDTATWDDVALVRRYFFPEVTVTNGFGLTEAGLVSWFTIPPTAPLGEGPLPVGRPLPGVAVSIVDDDGRPLPAGMPGRIVVDGVHCAAGYWGSPDGDAGPFSALLDGRRRVLTGDAGALMADGTLRHLGRLDDMVKVFGNRIELAEVEAALLTIDGVSQAAVLPYVGDQGNTRLRAVAVPGAGATLDGRVLRAVLGRRLPVAMVPDSVRVVPDIPRLVSGKVDRAGLAELAADAADAAAETPPYRAPVTERERQLTAIWSQVLRVDRIGLDDDFFDLGGNSIRAARVMTELQRLTGIDRPVSTIYEAPTPAQLAVAVDMAPDALEILVPFRADGSAPPLFVLHGGAGDIVFARNLLGAIPVEVPVYGIQPPIAVLRGVEPPAPTVEQLAAGYLAEVRRVQPGGPYRLFGYSFGGLVVYEMARQLIADGTAVGVLAVGDTQSFTSASPAPPPATAPSRTDRLDHKWEALRAARGRERLFLPLRFGWRYGRWIATRDPDNDDRRAIRHALRHGQPVPPDLREGYLVRAYTAVARGYRPASPYRGPLLYLRANDDNYVRDAAGQRPVPAMVRLASGPVEIVDLPCDHRALVHPPFARQVAAAISRAMEGSTAAG